MFQKMVRSVILKRIRLISSIVKQALSRSFVDSWSNKYQVYLQAAELNNWKFKSA